MRVVCVCVCGGDVVVLQIATCNLQGVQHQQWHPAGVTGVQDQLPAAPALQQSGGILIFGPFELQQSQQGLGQVAVTPFQFGPTMRAVGKR